MQIPYGESHIELDLDSVNATIVEPRFIRGLADEQSGFKVACSSPIGSPPLSEVVQPTDRLAVCIPDATRPFPSDRVLSWLFEYLSYIPNKNVVIINGTALVNVTSEILFQKTNAGANKINK